MNEEYLQIISGIVYPRIEFVARRNPAQRFGLWEHSRAPRGIRRRKHVITRAIAQSQLVPTLEIQRTARIGPSRGQIQSIDPLCKRATILGTLADARFFRSHGNDNADSCVAKMAFASMRVLAFLIRRELTIARLNKEDICKI